MVVQVARARPPPLAGVEPEVTVPVGPRAGPGAHWHPSHGMPWAARLGPGVTVELYFINHTTRGNLFIELEVIAKLQHGQNST